MSFFVDTGVWSGALRRDAPSSATEVDMLAQTIEAGETLFTTGLVLQELLQGFSGPRDRDRISTDFPPFRSSRPSATIMCGRRICAIVAAMACKSARSMRCSRSCASVMT